MNLDDLNIQVRERTLGELIDLAILLTRRHCTDLALLACVGSLPFAVFDWLLLRGEDEASWLGIVWLVVLLLAQAPLATASLTAYLGEAMFSRQPSVRSALITAARRLPVLGLAALLRGVVVAVPVAALSTVADGVPGLIALVALVALPAHVVEVALLERLPVKATFRRANQLMTAWRAEAVTHLMVGGLMVAGGSLVVGSALLTLYNLLFWQTVAGDWWSWVHPATSPLPAGLPWIFIAFSAVVRFLTYLDVRTRREGWEIELELRRAGRRLEAAGDQT